MTKSQVKKRLKEFCDGAEFIKRSQIAKAFGMKKPDSANKFVKGLEKVPNTAYYDLDEVAEQIALRGAQK